MPSAEVQPQRAGPAAPAAASSGPSTAWLRARDDRRLAWLAAGLTVAVGIVGLLIANRGSWFRLDDWDFVFNRSDLSAATVFTPQNQNCHATVVLIYRVMIELFGLNSYLPWRLLLAALIAALGVLGYLYARPRIGPWWALLSTALLIISPGYEILMWPFQMGQALSAVCGVGVLALLDRSPTRLNRAVIAVLLLIGVASSSAGIPLVAVFVYDRLLRPGRRSDLLLSLPAIIFYGWWYLEYQRRAPAANESTPEAYSAAIQRAYGVGNTAVDQLLGLGSQGAKGLLSGQIGFALLIVIVCWRIFGPYHDQRGRIAALLGGLIAYWVLLSWGRPFVQVENSPRYLFLSQILLVLLIVELAPGAKPALADARGRGWPFVRPLVVVVAAAVVMVGGLALLHNARTEKAFGLYLRMNATAMRGQVYGLWLLEPQSRASATINLEPLTPQIGRPATQYFETVDQFGGASGDETDVLALPASGRQRADQVLFNLYAPPTPARPSPRLRFGGPAPAAMAVAATPATLSPRGPCVRFQTAGPAPATLDVPGSASGLAVKNTSPQAITIKARRYAPDFTGPVGFEIPPAATIPIRLAPDRGTRPWQLQVTGLSGQLCSLSPT